VAGDPAEQPGAISRKRQRNSNPAAISTPTSRPRIGIRSPSRSSIICESAGNHMTYWHQKTLDSATAAPGSPNYIPNLDFASGLIKNDDGSCGSWAGLLMDVLRAQGVNAYEFRITPTNGAKYAGFLVKSKAGQGGALADSFANHAVVELTPNGGDTVYDPSYGTWFPSEQAWMDGSVEAMQQPGNLPDVPYLANTNAKGLTFTNQGQ
jgi:hypothetical protein